MQTFVLPKGIHAAVVHPFDDDYRLDEDGYRAQLEFVQRQPGITGLLINGHAGENYLTSDEEKRRIVEITRACAGNLAITSGVYSESSTHAAAQARMLEEAGADALLVFQPFNWAVDTEPQSILTHHKMIHDAVGTPIVLYQAPAAGRLAYSPAVIESLIGLERVLAVKDGSWELVASENVRNQINAARPEVMVFGSGDEHLMANYLIGTVGSQVSLAAVVPDIICRLWNATEAGDWASARQCHAVIQPLAQLIYRRAPACRAVARLKACLHILGVIRNDAVRPPLARLDRTEYADLELALKACAI
ncbi:dihydrodipicolinate synthase family protein [Acuticoccus kandeliae]|uniref:dihydrodipicolinate synthase family protein n=1 Tax=Acuticoccus kandeliae TaxID=2073160 RepID=UPI000D3EA4E6|nr:dihydrodipicolinate synthase family protein [Acuticoccus kandeliae]